MEKKFVLHPWNTTTLKEEDEIKRKKLKEEEESIKKKKRKYKVFNPAGFGAESYEIYDRIRYNIVKIIIGTILFMLDFTILIKTY